MCTSGIIRTAVSNLDRESRDHYAVVIQAKDMAGSVGGLSGSTTVNITLTDVNDNPPKFSQSKWSNLYTNEYILYILPPLTTGGEIWEKSLLSPVFLLLWGVHRPSLKPSGLSQLTLRQYNS